MTVPWLVWPIVAVSLAAESDESTASTSLSGASKRIYGYVSAHRGGAGYLMAVQSWAEASPYILATGQEVLPLGGFSGSVPEPTLAHVQQLVRSGQLRFFLLGGRAGPGLGGDTAGSESQKIASWVASTCARVPAKAYGGTSGTAGSGTSSGAGRAAGVPGGLGTLYECGQAS